MEFGSMYARWDINEKILSRNSVVWSAGVGKDVSFEESLMLHLHIRGVVFFDPTKSSIDWYNNRDNTNLAYSAFVNCGVLDRDGAGELFHHSEPTFQTESCIPGGNWRSDNGYKIEVRKISTLARVFNQVPDYLKLCLGGDAEYYTIKTMIDEDVFPTQLAYLQLHWNEAQRSEIHKKLIETGYNLEWSHPQQGRVRYERINNENS